MTAKTPAQLLTSFETGDVPQQTDYQDLFDSYVNVVQTAAQSIASDLSVQNFNAQTVSAQSVNLTNGATIGGGLSVGGSVTGSAATFASVSAAGAGVFGSLSTTGAVNGGPGTFASVSAQSISTSAATTNILYRLSVDTSVRAVGTTQGTAKTLAAQWNLVVSGSAADNSGILLQNGLGTEQVVFNNTNFNLKVYPPSGGAINDLGSNNAYTVSASLASSFFCLTATPTYRTK